jgi:hypothetical protein
MGDFRTVTQWTQNNVDVDATESNTSAWFRAPAGKGFSVFYTYTSAGAAEIQIDLQLSPVAEKIGRGDTSAKDPDDYYEEFTIVSAVANKDTDTWVDDLATNCPHIDRPFASYRVKVTITVADATDIYVAVCSSGLGS